MEIDELVEKLKEIGFSEEEAVSLVEETLKVLSVEKMAEREEVEFISNLFKKYGIKTPF